MGDAALHTLFGDISRLEAFAAIMLGEHPLEPSEGARYLARMAEGLARDRDRRRDPAGAAADEIHLATFRAAYLLARERAPAPPRPLPDGDGRAPKRVRALCALFLLRHRQRAALALRYVLGFSAAQVSSVVGAPPKLTDSVLRAGLQAVVRRVGGSAVDARRALRAAGATLGNGAGAPAPRKPVREPRAVMRLLLAPPPGARTDVPAPSGNLWLPRPVYVPWQAPSRAPRTAPQPAPAASSWLSARWERIVAAAAVIVVLMSLALVPRSTPIPRTPLAVVPLAPRLSAAAPTHRAGPIAAVYRVRAGDTLWSIADRVLGDPFRWPEVWRKNAGTRMTDGVRFTDPDRIRPGWVLALPSTRPG
jgi:nucleoid-associated protein YgaU